MGLIEFVSQCPLCSRQLMKTTYQDANYDRFSVTCHICGTYRITGTMLSCCPSLPTDTKPILSAIVRRHFDLKGQPETITSDNWEALASQAPAKNDVPSKVRYLLRYIAEKSQSPGNKVVLNGQTDYPICFAANAGEFEFYIQYAQKVEFLDTRASVGPGPFAINYWLLAKGWEETRRIPTIESPYAFVAMSLDKKGKDADLLSRAFKEAIQPAIEDDAGYQAVRIDEEQFLGDIVFEIMARIKDCHFVIADVTEHRHGVYFEAGYAMGMGLPVIWTCHDDDMKEAHFDTNHLNHIVWKDIGELRNSLKNRILGTSIGRGPIKRGSD